MAGSHLYRAFGVSFASQYRLPALGPFAGPAEDPTHVLESAPEAIAAGWPATGGERVLQEGEPGSVAQRFVERHPEAGHRLYAGGFGDAIVSSDGRAVTCVAGDAPAGRLERFLVGRVLPWAALVRGNELFHAAAVVLDRRAVLLIGPSGAGKTSLAIQLVIAGARFLSDDVLAVEDRADGAPLAHPGARVAGLRAPERRRLNDSERERLGELRALDEKEYATFSVDPEPVAIGAIVFVTRPPAPGPALERLQAPSAEALLSSAFIVSVRTPRRLQNQLAVCAQIATTVPQYRARVTPGQDARALAALIEQSVRRDRRPGP